MAMRRSAATVVALLIVLAACGGDDSGNIEGTADSGGSEGGESASSSGGGIVDEQPAGQAFASVEGQEFTLEVSPALECVIEGERITYAFWVGDNSIVMGGGANLYEDGWLGNIDLRIADPEGEPGPVTYYPDLQTDGDRISIDGSSMSYSGPMLKQPPNDGTNPPPVDAGEGTFSVTCP